MAFRASGIPKIKKKSLPSIESTVYSAIGLNDLVVFCVQYLQERGIAVTVEEMVSICFRLFPQSFSLQNYPRWPDSALVVRRLNDCREKGLIRGSSLDGFELKYKGQKLAERTAKALGLVKAAVVKKRAPASKSKTVKMRSVKKVVSKPQPKLSTKKTSKKIAVKSRSIQSRPAKQKVIPKPAIQKQAKKIVAKSTVKTHVKTPVKIQKNKTQSGQMKMALPIKEVPPSASPVKQVMIKKKSAPAPQLTRLQAIQPEIMIPAKEAKSSAPQLVVSKEEKVKAEKIVRAMERSDAYKIYSKNGHGSKLSEFDFRNMLFATMESTPETLIRNVNLFKGSASIHNRQDLIKFLDFCEGHFASLLKPTVKKAVKKK
jgi:hypothetical protein